MAASSQSLCDEDEESLSARELALLSNGERTASRTHLCCHAARLLFLISHGLLLLVVSASLEGVDQADWWVLFLPVWVGNSICLALVALSWCASCPYIKACLSERQPRLNDSPSILTEVLPEMVMSIPGVVFLVLTFCGEYFLCAYLSSAQHGEPRSLPTATIFFVIVALLSLCQGTLFTQNSVLWLVSGTGLLCFAACFAATRQPGCSAFAQSLSVLPFILAVAALLIASVRRLQKYLRVLSAEERLLLSAEAVILGSLLVPLCSAGRKISRMQLHAAGPEGVAAGLLLCLLALPRARLCFLEAQRGLLEDRLFCNPALPPSTAAPSEVEVRIA
ncbi:unnamed protein product [Polarella glacialis]|uniref:Uncharacterized protein n=1 Tax=Polarella glacialis TaxID=89957 RepID=A0A813KF94_POLGL|nr:unnamed protein product [Polarella glacialis]